MPRTTLSSLLHCLVGFGCGEVRLVPDVGPDALQAPPDGRAQDAEVRDAPLVDADGGCRDYELAGLGLAPMASYELDGVIVDGAPGWLAFAVPGIGIDRSAPARSSLPVPLAQPQHRRGRCCG